MKKSIGVRVVMSVVAIALTVAVNLATAPTVGLVSANAALGQMAHSDASYVAAITEMRGLSLLSGVPIWVLLLVLVALWGSLLFKNRNKP
jgi:hypothetical protein